MNRERKEITNIDSCKVGAIKVTGTPELFELFSKEYVNNNVQKNSDKLVDLEKLFLTLINRIKNIEKNIVLKELEKNLNKHYEQSRRR